MISAQKYEYWLNERFILKNKELFQAALKWELDFSKVEKSGDYPKLIDMLDEIEEKYEFNMQKMCSTNFQLISLFQIEFQKEVDIIKRNASLKFLIACCLIDKILDSKRYCKDEQLSVVERLTSQWGTECVKKEVFPELDELLYDVRKYLDDTINLKNKEYLHGAIRKAYTSEIYMWEHVLLPKEKLEKGKVGLLIDKSIEFEKAALLLSLGDNISKESMKVAEIIAEITWLADDLCDFLEDIRCKRKNSLLFVALPEREYVLEERAEDAINHMEEYVEKLEKAMKALKYAASENLYYFVINLVWKWFAEIRRISDKS